MEKKEQKLKIKNILVSQPQPVDFEKSPFSEIAKKYNVNFEFNKFIKIEGITSSDFRKDNKITILDYTAVIFNSKNAVDHFFRLCKEMRIEIPDAMKYFCISESTAYYLQKYVQFRKRKIFHDYNGKDSKNQSIKYTLIRFLNSKGYRKDASGVNSLTDEEVHYIESGVANVEYLSKIGFKTRIYQAIMGYQSYKAGGNPSGNSLFQRVEYWKASIYLIKHNFLIGVGTGDMACSNS